MKILGLEFAPMNVPFRRRLQTLSVLYLTSSFMFFGILGAVLWIYILFTSYYYLAVMYMTWMYYDWEKPKHGSRPIKFLRRCKLWRYFAGYFPVKLVKTANLDPNKNYVIGFHPHGIIVAGCSSNFASDATGFPDAYPGIKPHVLTLDGNFQVPFHREFLMWLGFCSVSRESINWILQKQGKGNAVIIVVGGAAEALDARPGEATLTIKRRKGFVRIAMMNGASLVPIYSFGENELYEQLYNPIGSPLRKIQEKLTHFLGVSPPIFHGRGVFNYSFGFLPRRSPIHTVVGKPIDCEKNPNPTREEVDKVHNEYLQQLKELYDEYKGKYGNPEQELIFV